MPCLTTQICQFQHINQATSTMTQLATASDAVFFWFFFWHLIILICASLPGHEEAYLASFIEKMEKGGHGASHLAAFWSRFDVFERQKISKYVHSWVFLRSLLINFCGSPWQSLRCSCCRSQQDFCRTPNRISRGTVHRPPPVATDPKRHGT